MPKLFTPEVISDMRRWAEQGVSVEEMAWRIGSTPGSIMTMCSRVKIKVGKRDRVKRICFVLDRATALSFNEVALRKETTVDALASKLIATIVNDDLYHAILDD